MLTLKRINSELENMNSAERLAKGKGFFYFHGGRCPQWTRTCVWVDRLNDLTLSQWIGQRANMAATVGTFPLSDEEMSKSFNRK